MPAGLGKGEEALVDAASVTSHIGHIVTQNAIYSKQYTANLI